MTRRKAVPIVKPPITWILVADSRQAQVYTRNRVEKLIPLAGNSRRNQFEEIISHEPLPVPGMKWQAESADGYEIGRNKTGMVFESASNARSMSAPHMDVRDEIRNHFARMVADHISQAKAAKSFDRLVLVAAPKMLGEIKKHLDAKTLKSVAAEMPKDLTHYEGEELLQHLRDSGI
jgi:protein required for attachment to host cells